MVILSQIVGAGDFSLVDNLRLIVIAASFIGIIALLLYLKFANSGGKADGKYISKEKAGENINDIANSAEGTGEGSVVGFDVIDEKIKNSEAEIVAKFEAVIKGLRAQVDTKLTAEVEGLVSKIEEREEAVVKRLENVIDRKIQEALNKMSDKVGDVLYAQKSSTAAVLEKLVDSLRTEEIPAGSLASVKAEKDIEEISEIQGSKATGLSNIEEASKLNETECEPAGVSGANKLQEEKPFISSDISEGAAENTADVDMQEFLNETPVEISSTDEPDTAVDGGVVPTEIKEEELEVQPEDKADMGLEENEQITSPGKNEGKVSGNVVEDEGDFDMQAFLDAEPVSILPSGESSVVEEGVVSEGVAGQEEPSEDNANVELDDMVTGGMVGDSADFDIQEFLDELENLPSENDSEAEK